MSASPKAFGKALTKGLDILEALQSSQAALSFAELRRRVDVSPASFARFLKILTERGYARRDPDGAYRLGWRAAEVGVSALEGFPLRAAARPHLEALAAATLESAELVAFEGDQFVFADRVECQRSVVLRARVGSRFEVSDRTAIGRLAIAMETSGKRSRGFPGLALVRKTGFADLLQNNREVYRAAAALFDRSGGCTGCLCLAAPAFRVGRLRKVQFKKLLLERSRELSRKPERAAGRGAS